MSSQPSGTPDMTVPAQYSHFLQMWEFLENTSGLQDGDFIVVQAPGSGQQEKGVRRWLQSAWYSPNPKPKPSPSQVPAAEGKAE